MKRKRSLKALKREADKVFAAWIRRRDSASLSSRDEGCCVTCGAWCVLETSHFIPRQFMATRYDPRNSHGACSYCNRWLHGNLINYTLFMQKTYGQEVVDELLAAKHKTVKMTRSDYEALIAKYSRTVE